MSSTDQLGPVEGPCVAWISGADVADCIGAEYNSETAAGLDEKALSASMLLYELSGRKFTGGCEQTVRPCRPTCSCWDSLIGPGGWNLGTAGWYFGPWGNSFAWQDGCGGICGCGVQSKVLLDGYPVTKIVRVMLGDVELPEFDTDTGRRNWRLDGWKYLTRIDTIDDQGVVQPQRWPACQNLSLDDGDPGTWTVTYDYGVAPPLPGLDAAAQLAGELYKACNGGECALPQGVTRMQRQGVTIERGLLLTWSNAITSRGIRSGSWTTGLELVDAFLSAYNPFGNRRRPAFWSPDLPQFAQKLGT
jgi:hypothetical protein